MKLDKDTLRDLIDEKLPRGQVRAIQSGYKDRTASTSTSRSCRSECRGTTRSCSPSASTCTS